jgi:hypothetical protein
MALPAVQLHPLLTIVDLAEVVVLKTAAMVVVVRPTVITTRSTTRLVQTGVISPALFGAAAQCLRLSGFIRRSQRRTSHPRVTLAGTE